MHESVKKAYDEFYAEKRASAKLANPGAWAREQAGQFGERFGDAAVGGVVKSLTDHLVSRPINSVYDLLKKKLVTEPKQRAVFQQAVSDPEFAEHYDRNPQAVDDAYGVAKQYAPSLTMNPAVLRSLLRQSVMSGGTMDLATARMLADIERTVQQAKSGRGGSQ